jgi:N-acetylneuraminic acid mutarotase
VLNTETLQWSTAADLPQPMKFALMAVCVDQIYIMGVLSSCMYICSLQALIQSFPASIRNRGARVWKEVDAPPVERSTCVSIHGRLLAIGGRESAYSPSSAIHMYNPTTDSWEVISHMGTSRWQCIAAVLPNNRLMVVGGFISDMSETCSVEFASFQ